MLDVIAEQIKLKDIVENVERASIAIVDDDAAFSFMLKDYLLSSADMKADVFSSGEEFLRNYKAKDERKIILDYDFGKGLDGLAILNKIKSINPSAVVIMVSSQDSIETAIETIRRGATDYFIKTNKSVFAQILSSLMKLLEIEKHKLN